MHKCLYLHLSCLCWESTISRMDEGPHVAHNIFMWGDESTVRVIVLRSKHQWFSLVLGILFNILLHVTFVSSVLGWFGGALQWTYLNETNHHHFTMTNTFSLMSMCHVTTMLPNSSMQKWIQVLNRVFPLIDFVDSVALLNQLSHHRCMLYILVLWSLLHCCMEPGLFHLPCLPYLEVPWYLCFFANSMLLYEYKLSFHALCIWFHKFHRNQCSIYLVQRLQQCFTEQCIAHCASLAQCV